jgi:hypothetical protein
MRGAGDSREYYLIEKMSVEEKIQAMEFLWDDLCGRADDVVSPKWHGEVLAERETAIERGEDNYIDWKTVKQNIKKEI